MNDQTDDYEDPEFTQIKAQKDAIEARQNERLRNEGRSSVRFIRCMECLTVPQQNKSEATGAECGGCIAKERDALRAKVGRLEDALDVTRSNFTFVSNSLEARNKDALAAEAQRDAAIEQVKVLEAELAKKSD